jgi:hypothetical protein
LRAAESQRADLIDKMNLRRVGERVGARRSRKD